jgi:glutamyl-tRNA synthetase
MVATPPSAGQAALIEAAAPLIQTRISRLTEAVGMLAFLFAGDDGGFKVEPEDAERFLTPDALPVLQAAEVALAEVEPWTHEAIEAALREALIEGLGLKPRVAFAPVRVAVTGKRVSPPLYQSIELLGRERTLHRLAAAIKSIG